MKKQKIKYVCINAMIIETLTSMCNVYTITIIKSEKSLLIIGHIYLDNYCNLEIRYKCTHIL